MYNPNKWGASGWCLSEGSWLYPGFGPKSNDFLWLLLLEAEISRFSDQSQRNSKKSVKFECKMVDYHWDQLVLGLGYHFLSF